jgi:hypothetical protein
MAEEVSRDSPKSNDSEVPKYIPTKVDPRASPKEEMIGIVFQRLFKRMLVPRL